MGHSLIRRYSSGDFMSRSYLACVVGFALTLGCGSSSQNDHAASGAPADQRHSASTGQGLVDGHYIFGAEVNTFSPCGSAKTYWVVGDSTKMASLRTSYLKWFTAAQPQPYSPMFAQFRGAISDGKRDGFAEDYDGLFSVDEIVLLRGINQGDCQPLSSREGRSRE
jgi:hypothetical protein